MLVEPEKGIPNCEVIRPLKIGRTGNEEGSWCKEGMMGFRS